MVILGLTLIWLGFVIVFNLFAPIIFLELQYQLNQDDYARQKVAINTENALELSISNNLPLTSIIIPKDATFSIVIPTLNINEKVIENVDPNDQANYNIVLRSGVAQALGSGLPGDQKGMLIFAHSARSALFAHQYDAQFYLIENLKTGDLIYIYYQNQEYQYRVISNRIVNPNNLESVDNIPENQLILMTCYPAGINSQRLLVAAEQVLNTIY